MNPYRLESSGEIANLDAPIESLKARQASLQKEVARLIMDIDVITEEIVRRAINSAAE